MRTLRRFALRVRYENRIIDTYTVTVGKLKLTPSDADAEPTLKPNGNKDGNLLIQNSGR